MGEELTQAQTDEEPLVVIVPKVRGYQCNECGSTTIVRHPDHELMWRCLECSNTSDDLQRDFSEIPRRTAA